MVRTREVQPEKYDLGVLCVKKLATLDTFKNLVKYLRTDFTAPKASRLESSRAISLSGDVTGSAPFDGSDDVSVKAKVPAISGMFREPSKVYPINSVAYLKEDDAKYRLVCVEPGKTSANKTLDFKETEESVKFEDADTLTLRDLHLKDGKWAFGDN